MQKAIAVIVGNLTREPEFRHTSNGTAKCKLSVAVGRKYKDSEGQLQESTSFFNVVAWGKQAENCAAYLQKGQEVLCQCRPESFSFENDEGQRITGVQFIAEPFGVVFGSKPGRKSGDDNTPEPEAPAIEGVASDDEEVPF